MDPERNTVNSEACAHHGVSLEMPASPYDRPYDTAPMTTLTQAQLGASNRLASSFRRTPGESLQQLKFRMSEGCYILVGVCAMAKKSRSKYMLEILERLERFQFIRTFVFDESIILQEPVEQWPLCDAMIAFYSKGFPLDKAIGYQQLRSPLIFNDLEMQYALTDRREVYSMLNDHGLPHPRYTVLNRESDNPQEHDAITETEDQVTIGTEIFAKPFVEKPVSAEDHDIYIYFPSSAGGGSQRLFRKNQNRSSIYANTSKVRKAGSYIYEEFIATDGCDIKVYTLGPDYAHAEARKSPALDGKVERDKDGKEVRFPVILTAAEKMIARKVVEVFKQFICGFDLLRTANNKTYVCDVNGFSFVKTSIKYYDDSAKILGTEILNALAPKILKIAWPITPAVDQTDSAPRLQTNYGRQMELRCVIGVMRHGDRTPKQKMKMEATHSRFLDLFKRHNGFKNGSVKFKRPKLLQEVLDIARFLLSEQRNPTAKEPVTEERYKLEQIKYVLEMYGRFTGINRKVQIKYQPKRSLQSGSLLTVANEAVPKKTSLLFILKWGGEVTPAGRTQAEDQGIAFRNMYPGGQGDYRVPGLGLLRLHSTFRHDLKIYASDEGRVQMTAAAFAKGFLALENELAPILVQIVKSANTQGLLDFKELTKTPVYKSVRDRLQRLLNLDCDLNTELKAQLNPTGSKSLTSAINYVKNPRRACERIMILIQELLARIKELEVEAKVHDFTLYSHESWELLVRRWSKLAKDFYEPEENGSGTFNVSKIPDIYDCIKYDWQYNQEILQFSRSDELYILAKAMADIVIPQEYGMTSDEKMHIGTDICAPLLRKIVSDLTNTMAEEGVTMLDTKHSHGVTTPERHVRTRLYFTSESHVHSLINVLCHGQLADPNVDPQWRRAIAYLSAVSELNYLTQIIIMLYENQNKDSSADDRFHIEIHFSPGAYCLERNFPAGQGLRSASHLMSKMGNCGSIGSGMGEMQSLGSTSSFVSLKRLRRFFSEEIASRDNEGVSAPPTLPTLLSGINLSEGGANMHQSFSSKEPSFDVADAKGGQTAELGARNEDENENGRDAQEGSHPQVTFQISQGPPFLLQSNLSTSLPNIADGFKGTMPATLIEDNVPKIRPCETLHNALTLNQLRTFISLTVSETGHRRQHHHHHHHREISLLPSVNSDSALSQKASKANSEKEQLKTSPRHPRLLAGVGDLGSWSGMDSYYGSAVSPVRAANMAAGGAESPTGRPTFASQASAIMGAPVLPFSAERLQRAPDIEENEQMKRLLTLAIGNSASNTTSTDTGNTSCDCSSASPTPPISVSGTTTNS